MTRGFQTVYVVLDCFCFYHRKYSWPSLDLHSLCFFCSFLVKPFLALPCKFVFSFSKESTPGPLLLGLPVQLKQTEASSESVVITYRTLALGVAFNSPCLPLAFWENLGHNLLEFLINTPNPKLLPVFGFYGPFYCLSVLQPGLFWDRFCCRELPEQMLYTNKTCCSITNYKTRTTRSNITRRRLKIHQRITFM